MAETKQQEGLEQVPWLVRVDGIRTFLPDTLVEVDADGGYVGIGHTILRDDTRIRGKRLRGRDWGHMAGILVTTVFFALATAVAYTLPSPYGVALMWGIGLCFGCMLALWRKE